VAEVVTDDLRVRTWPGTGEASTKLEPLLKPGTKLYVVDGPVGDSGYRWYKVMTIDPSIELSPPGDAEDEPFFEEGWVAVADTTGEPWVQAAKVPCPAAPSTVEELVDVDDVTALACFGDAPLTLRARVLSCFDSPELKNHDACQPDTGGIPVQPDWFNRSYWFLVPPQGVFNARDSMLEFHDDPLGTAPEPIPLGIPVTVTGRFNHPAASACAEDWLGTIVATVYCRTVFAVTAVEVD
jgi:hypothetical protein